MGLCRAYIEGLPRDYLGDYLELPKDYLGLRSIQRLCSCENNDPERVFERNGT